MALMLAFIRLYWWVRWGKVHCRSSWRVGEQWRCYQLGRAVFIIIGDPWLTRNPKSMQIGAQFNGIGFRFILRDSAMWSWSMLCQVQFCIWRGIWRPKSSLIQPLVLFDELEKLPFDAMAALYFWAREKVMLSSPLHQNSKVLAITKRCCLQFYHLKVRITHFSP